MLQREFFVSVSISAKEITAPHSVERFVFSFGSGDEITLKFDCAGSMAGTQLNDLFLVLGQSMKLVSSSTVLVNVS